MTPPSGQWGEGLTSSTISLAHESNRKRFVVTPQGHRGISRRIKRLSLHHTHQAPGHHATCPDSATTRSCPPAATFDCFTAHHDATFSYLIRDTSPTIFSLCSGLPGSISINGDITLEKKYGYSCESREYR